jgi:energy-coupling factor transport system ATP-binding protein
LVLNKKEGISIIIISHNPEDLVQADRLIVLDQGAICLEGNPREVFSNAQLKSLGLNSPPLYQLFAQLESYQFSVPDNIKSIPELVEYICLEL